MVQTVEGFPLLNQYTIGVSCVPAILLIARPRHRGSVLQGIALEPVLYRLVQCGGLGYLFTSNVSGPYQIDILPYFVLPTRA